MKYEHNDGYRRQSIKLNTLQSKVRKMCVLQCYAFWELSISRRIHISTKKNKSKGQPTKATQQQYLNGNDRFVMIHLGNFTKAKRVLDC